MYRVIVTTKSGKTIESGDMTKSHAETFAEIMKNAYDSVKIAETKKDENG